MTDLRPGDLILTGAKSQGIISQAIKLGQRIRGFSKDERQWSHCYLVLDADGTMIEAAKKGVRITHTDHLHEGDWRHFSTGVNDADMKQIQTFCDAVLEAKWKYGFWTFAGLGIYCLTGGQLCIQKAGTAICSGLFCDALTRAGYVWERPPYAMMPADLHRHFVAKTA